MYGKENDKRQQKINIYADMLDELVSVRTFCTKSEYFSHILIPAYDECVAHCELFANSIDEKGG